MKKNNIIETMRTYTKTIQGIEREHANRLSYPAQLHTVMVIIPSILDEGFLYNYSKLVQNMKTSHLLMIHLALLLVTNIVHFKKIDKIDGKPEVTQLSNVLTYVNEDSEYGKGCPCLNDEVFNTILSLVKIGLNTTDFS